MAFREDPASQIDDATHLLTRRLRLALIGCLVPILLFALADLKLVRAQLEAVWALKVAALVVLGAALIALRRPRGRRRVTAIALLVAAAMYVLSSVSAVIASDPFTTPLLTISIAVSTATLLPWGLLPQLALVGIATVATAATIVVSAGNAWALVSYPNVGVAIGLLASVYIAFELERSRRRLARHALEQRRAETQVRGLNAELEQRVAGRTGELERVNRELAAEVGERRRAQAEQAALIENVGHAVWSVDRLYRIIAFNSLMAELYERFFGMQLVMGATLNERIPPEWRERWRDAYDRALGGERFSIELDIPLPEGVRCYSTSFHPIVADGAVTGFTAVSVDVTERKQAEEAERRHQAELTHVLRLATMGEMAAGLAHEINQPLAAIVNYACGCARRLRAGANDSGEIAGAVDQIAVEALRAGDIIRRLRRLVRKEAPRQEPLDLNSVVEDVIALFQPEIRQLAIAVEVRLERALPVVRGDPIQIEQVVLNLVRNGIESMAESRAARCLAVATTASRMAVELVVEDSGPGLSAAQTDRVFDAFFTTKSHGLGMGLSISRTIAESHRGFLVAEPCSSGARFRLTLPIAPQPGVETAPQTIADASAALLDPAELRAANGEESTALSGASS